MFFCENNIFFTLCDNFFEKKKSPTWKTNSRHATKKSCNVKKKWFSQNKKNLAQFFLRVARIYFYFLMALKGHVARIFFSKILPYPLWEYVPLWYWEQVPLMILGTSAPNDTGKILFFYLKKQTISPLKKTNLATWKRIFLPKKISQRE